jgi:hypothetical protein
LYGGTGADQISGYDDTATIYGDSGNDNIEMYSDYARIYGGNGNDQISAAATYSGSCVVDCGSGDDSSFVMGIAYGGDGNDRLATDHGTLFGGNSNDILLGGEIERRGHTAADLSGGSGYDLVLGGGPDESYGGIGNDILRGGELWGGTGTDTFEFRGVYGYYGRIGPALSVVHDFGAGENISVRAAYQIGVGEQYGSYDHPWTEVPLSPDDLVFARSGNDLEITGSPRQDADTGVMSASGMLLAGFFAAGHTSVKIDAVSVDLSDLAQS